jgi:fructokinase
MTRKIYGIGEIVLDIIFKNNQPVAAKAGGSVLNCMVSLGRMGLPAHFISELGNDQVGNYIVAFLNENGINSEFIKQYDKNKTALALAFLNEQNDANYSFYKDYPANRLDGAIPDFKENDILFFGSFYGIMKEIRPYVLQIVNKAKQAGAIVLYDPNFRKSHLHELNDLLPFIKENIALADIVRGSDEDFNLIFNTTLITEAYEKIKPSCPYLIVTANKKGVDIFTPTQQYHQDVKPISPVSTIGAGDNFNAGMVYSLLNQNITKQKINALTKEQWLTIANTGISFATAVCLSYDNYVPKDFKMNY